MDTQANSNIDIDKLRSIIREEVVAALQTFTGDPDAGLELKDEIIDKVKESQLQAKEGNTKTAEEVRKKHLKN